MQGELNTLLEILEDQRALQEELAGLSEKKIEIITAGKSAALQAIVEEEKGVLMQIKAVERRQSQSVARLATLLGLPVEDIRMSLIIDRAEGQQKARLETLRSQLSDCVDKQLRYNDINMRLLQMNMEYAQFLINTVSNQQAGPTYGNGGDIQKAATGTRRLLDRKV